jgi:4-carboxymuconolactone decarboxylase
LQALDLPTRELVRLAAIVTAGDEPEIREGLARAFGAVPDVWIEELLLQTHLFAGFPRALNGMREWRRISGARPGGAERAVADADGFRVAGEVTCSRVYGAMYDRLRHNIRELDPLLDDWMITDGYGKVLSRPGLDLGRRELCIIAACAAAGQERQLHSHLHGALNVGVVPEVIEAAVEALEGILTTDRCTATRLLWLRVKGK